MSLHIIEYSATQKLVGHCRHAKPLAESPHLDQDLVVPRTRLMGGMPRAGRLKGASNKAPPQTLPVGLQSTFG